MSEKISVEHLKRAAYVYIRQSSSQQVRFHLEGQKRQYGLADRARQLGFHKVVVIDEDLGRSGSGVQERPGFGRLLGGGVSGNGWSGGGAGSLTIGSQQSGLAPLGGSVCLDRYGVD
jgi:hypothetical protein